MSHVTVEQRYVISRMLSKNKKLEEIGIAIGKDKSVVSREIKRNRDQRSGRYKPELAHKKYQNRLHNKPKRVKLTEPVKEYIEKKLADKWSPEQISNSPNLEGLNLVSPESIYKYIALDRKKGGQLYTNLRRKKKRKKRCAPQDNRGKIQNAKGIDKRPKIVEKNTRVGDLEVDLIIGEKHKGALITINDRRSGRSWIKLTRTKDSMKVSKIIIKALEPYKRMIHTITSDNGKEFANFKMIEDRLEVEFFFADPYSSWQRGSNENLNGLIRQYFPKKTNFESLTWREVKHVEKMLNNRPRKRLGYRTPNEEFILLTKKVAFAA